MDITGHFIPYWADNPYQSSLAAGLRHLGIGIETGTALKSLSRRASRRADRAEVVHLHWLPAANPMPRRLVRWCLFPIRIAKLKRRGVPLVWTAHNVVPHESLLPGLDLWLSRTIAKRVDRIICHSSSARAELLDRLGVDNASKIRVIPHGHYVESYPNQLSSTACRDMLGLRPEMIVFLFVGAIRPYKGVVEMMDAFRDIDCQDARLLIAGKPLNEAINAQVESGAMADARVRYFPGFVPDDELQIYFKAADVVVFPYQKSLTSGAVILAMSFGKACLAPRLPGLADCVTENGGLFYDPEGADGLVRSMSQAVQERSRLREMGERNLERARLWDWQSIASATAACYGEALWAARNSGHPPVSAL